MKRYDISRYRSDLSPSFFKPVLYSQRSLPSQEAAFKARADFIREKRVIIRARQAVQRIYPKLGSQKNIFHVKKSRVLELKPKIQYQGAARDQSCTPARRYPLVKKTKYFRMEGLPSLRVID